MISNGYGSKKKEGARLRKTHEKYRQMAKIPNPTPQNKLSTWLSNTEDYAIRTFMKYK